MVHTIEAFFAYDPAIEVVVVLPEAHMAKWEALQSEFFASNAPVKVALGGATRYQSVAAGLGSVSGDLVAIHDAVRPLVSVEMIERCFDSAALHGAGVAMVPLKDSVRKIAGEKTETRDRSQYLLVQTPQTFQTKLIRKAFSLGEQPAFTDDASVYEAAGMKVTPVSGDYRNIKITTPEDLLIAKALMDQSE